MSLGETFYGQFKRPTGSLGVVVGHLMALKNGRRSKWALELLKARPGERIIEVGFGPGVDAARVLAAVGPAGSYAGADASEVMVRQATARNRAAVAAARAEFARGAIEGGLPWKAGEFDAAYSINCAQFWPELGAGLREVERLLRHGGRAVVAVQPMHRGATEADSDRWAERFVEAVAESGLRILRVERGPTRPSVVAVVVEKP
jgi:ubiquinone/menaquinone biosynthesis C-methylase UbiE